jgi:O-antigen/teichoic acid export membrane protein
LIAALPLAAALMIGGGRVVRWIFGAEYVSASNPLAILVLGQLVNAAFGSVGFLLNMTGHERIAARVLWQTAALNIAISLTLIPGLGVLGAAIGNAVSLAVWNLLLHRQVNRQLGISSLALPGRAR